MISYISFLFKFYQNNLYKLNYILIFFPCLSDKQVFKNSSKLYLLAKSIGV